MKRALLFAVAFFTASAARANFEGVLHMNLASPQAAGEIKFFISKSGYRQELSMSAPQGSLNLTTLMTPERPGVVVMINDEMKKYTEIDTRALKKAGASSEKFKVKQLGEMTVAGYRCKNVLITGDKTGEMELCVSKELMDYDTYAMLRAGDAGDPTGESFQRALKDAGADGFPIRSVHRGNPDGPITMELVMVEKKPVSPKLFKIPSGYAKSEGMMEMLFPAEAMEHLEKEMENMSPEQREMIEQMMKQGR